MPVQCNRDGEGGLALYGYFLQTLVNGILLGGIYVTIALGLNVIYGVMRIINYAQGDFLMIGMYVAYWLFEFFKIVPYAAVVPVAFTLFAIGFILYLYIVSPILRLPYESQVLTFVGLIFILQNLALIIWTADYRGVNIPLLYHPLTIGGIYIPLGRLLTLIFSIAITIIVYYFFKNTKFGKFIVASSQDPLGAEMIGIDTDSVKAIAMGLGIALAGIGGSILLPIYYVYPYVGTRLGILGFIIITLGGLGSFIGAIVGSFIIGLVESFIGTLLSSEIAFASALLIYILILLVRPTGLMGERS